MKEQILVVGGGGYAKVIISTIKKLDEYEIIGYTDSIDKGLVLGIKYLGTAGVLTDIIKKNKNCKAVIGIENISISNQRQKIYKMLKDIGFDLPVIIAKNAIVSEKVTIGEGTVILEGTIVIVDSIIGKCVIVNTGAIIEHDCMVGDFVHFMTGAIIGGGVEVGENSIIGVNAKVIQYKKVGKNCLIETGSIVINDTLIEGTYFGIPALLRSH